MMSIHCCTCDTKVEARLTDGKEIYPHRKDLWWLPFWKCDTCGNHVGCHHKTKNRTRPLGVIPSPQIKEFRKRIHLVLDPLWQSGKIDRKELYAKVTDHMGFKYHTASLRTVEECKKVLTFAGQLSAELNTKGLRICQ